MLKLIYLKVIVVMLMLYSSTYGQTIIASFENQEDFLNIRSSTGVKISQTTNFAALGAYSCEAAFPEKGGTVVISGIAKLQRTNIEAARSDVEESLLWFIWTDQPAEVTVILEDSLGGKFTKQFLLKTGANHLQIPASEMEKVNLKRILSIELTTSEKRTFYLDYLALDHYQPVLSKLGRWDVEYATDIKTSHFSWGSNLSTGPIKSYSISPIFDGRGIIELAQRLDLDYQVTTIGRTNGAEKYGYGDFYMRRSPWYGGDSTTYNLAHNYIADDLLYSPEFDVIIWPGLHAWETYPKVVRQTIMDRVRNGAGLLLLYPMSNEISSSLWTISPLISETAAVAQLPLADSEIASVADKLDRTRWVPEGEHYITRGVAFDAFPWGSMGVYPYKNNGGTVLVSTSNGNPVVSTKKYGSGRVVAMSYPERGLIPRIDDPWETGLNYSYWEYMWSLVARAVVWASQKVPETVIRDMSKTPSGITVNLRQVQPGSEIFLQIHDEFGVLEEQVTKIIPSKQSLVKLDLSSKLNGGKHIANIQVKGANGVLDWHSLTFYTDKIAEITAVENYKTEIPIGERVSTTILVESKDKVDALLTARLYDNYNRLIDESTRELIIEGNEEIDFNLNSENILTNYGKSEYFLTVNGEQTDHKAVEHFFLLPRVWDDYDVTMYHFGPNPIPGVWPAVDSQLQELNVTTLAAYTLSNSKHANYKVQAQTRIKGVESPDSGPDLAYYKEMKLKYIETKDKFLLKRKYGLKDSVYLDGVKSDLTAMVGEWKKFSPSAYYIYEEPSVTRYNDALDLCFRESTLGAMRLWLKEEYHTLNALNEQWGTDFSHWEQVIPDDSGEAQIRGNYSSWADHRTFMEICWADQFRFVQEVVDDIDQGGLVQLSGTQAASSHNGYDYSRLNKYVGQMNPYDIDNQLEYHHNFNPELKVSGQAGYGALGKDVLYDYYHHLFLKETGGSYVFWQASCLNPDLRISQSGSDMKAGFDELLGRGIGKLLVAYEPENELKIAVHFSYPSVHGSWIVDGKIGAGQQENDSNTLKQFNRNRDGWVKALHDSGQGFDFISYTSIENGGLFTKGYKVLILPMSYAISDKEVEQLDKFVKNGGILIADALPGVMDNHTKFSSRRSLAELFGIKDRIYTKEELITPQSESQLTLSTGTALEKGNGLSHLIYNRYGKGSAYLLNFFLDKYTDDKRNHDNYSLDKINQILDKENLESGIRLTMTSGNSANGIEKYLFYDEGGRARLLGLLPGKGKDDIVEEINLQFKEQIHLYDIRDSKYLGEASEFRLNVRTSEPEFFGLIPGKIETIDVSAPDQANLGEQIRLDLKLGGQRVSDMKSVVCISVHNPEGERIPYYSDNRDLTNGTCIYTFNTALNDPPGDWKIRVTEVISGIGTESTIKVR